MAQDPLGSAPDEGMRATTQTVARKDNEVGTPFGGGLANLEPGGAASHLARVNQPFLYGAFQRQLGEAFFGGAPELCFANSKMDVTPLGQRGRLDDMEQAKPCAEAP